MSTEATSRHPIPVCICQLVASPILNFTKIRSRIHRMWSEDYTKCYLPGPMFGPYSFINISYGREVLDDRRSRKNLVEVAVVMKLVQLLFKGMFF